MSAVLLTQRLTALSETPVAPAWAIAFALKQSRQLPRAQSKGLTALRVQLAGEADAVNALAERLRGLPPSWPPQKVTLL